MLPKIVKAVDGRAKIIVDGGFLRGADICKGICAGADLVAMGRFVALGMAAGGEESLVRAFDLLLEEMHTVMVRCLHGHSCKVAQQGDENHSYVIDPRA